MMRTSTAHRTSRTPRLSGRAVSCVGAVLRERPDAPRLISHETGEQLSASAWAKSKAQGEADHYADSSGFDAARRRYVRAVCRAILLRAEPQLRHVDELKLAMWRVLEQSSCRRKRGSQFWIKQYVWLADVARDVWYQHTEQERVRRDARLVVAAVDALAEEFGGL